MMKEPTINVIKKGIYLIESECPYILGFLFLRVQEFMENPKFRHKRADLIEIIYDYTVKYKSFDYCTRYTGYNIPSEIINKVYLSLSKSKYTIFDKQFLQLISAIKEDKYYLIGTLKEDKGTLNHELHHAYYYLDEQYRKNIDKLVEELRINHKKEYKSIVRMLKRENYDESVFIDEIAAYIIDGTYTINRNKFLNEFERQNNISIR